MRQRIGLILCVTGIILLLKPNFDFDQMMLTLNYLTAQYWPVCFVAAGVVLISPKKKRKTRYH
ncbi:MAG: hypothetical protein HFG16_06965 [Erysipelotrichaceae bacterium]|jgi:hypothetical protein|nr:hypothetical protein [Erysipelotrichaceae bacterium]